MPELELLIELAISKGKLKEYLVLLVFDKGLILVIGTTTPVAGIVYANWTFNSGEAVVVVPMILNGAISTIHVLRTTLRVGEEPLKSVKRLVGLYVSVVLLVATVVVNVVGITETNGLEPSNLFPEFRRFFGTRRLARFFVFLEAQMIR